MLMLILFSRIDYSSFRYRIRWFLFGASLLLCEQFFIIAAAAYKIPAIQVHSGLQKTNIAVFTIWLIMDLFLFRNILKKEAVITSGMQAHYITKQI